jgi:hypothetical protein
MTVEFVRPTEDIVRQDNDISGASSINTASNEVSPQGRIMSLANSTAWHLNNNICSGQ